jgi:tRNA G46 methylase TrmB
MIGDEAKWSKYYESASVEGASAPPWESDEPFAPLLELLSSTNTNFKSPLDLHTLAGVSVIELGSGCSPSICYLAKTLPNCRAVAIDISPVAIERAKQRLPDSQLVEWVCADLLADEKEGNLNSKPNPNPNTNPKLHINLNCNRDPNPNPNLNSNPNLNPNPNPNPNPKEKSY